MKVLLNSDNVIIAKSEEITVIKEGRFQVEDTIYGQNLELTLVETELSSEVLLVQQCKLVDGEVVENENYVVPEDPE